MASEQVEYQDKQRTLLNLELDEATQKQAIFRCENRQRVAIDLQRRDRKSMQHHKTNRAEPHQKEINQALGISAHAASAEKTIAPYSACVTQKNLKIAELFEVF